MNPLHKTLIAAVLVMAVAACGTPDEGNPTPSPQPNTSQIVGTWQVASNDLFTQSGFGELRFIEFTSTGADGAVGTGQMLGQHASTGVLACGAFIYAEQLEGVVAISSGDFGEDGGSKLYIARAGETTLSLTDESGQEIQLVRAASIPEASRCKSANIVNDVVPIIALEQFANLVFDGTQFWTTTDNGNETIPVNVRTGTVGTPITSSSPLRHVHAFSGGEFWAHCGCGGSQEASLGINGVVSDEIDTDTDLNNQISVRGIAVNGPTLFLAGRNRNSGITELLKVDPSSEPDILNKVTTLDGLFTSGMVFHDGDLWMVSRTIGSVLFRLDFNTGQVDETIKLPGNVFWHGVSSDGVSLYVIGDTGNASRILEITP